MRYLYRREEGLLSMTPFPLPARSHVHLWHINLDLSDTTLTDSQGLLSPDELARANRFHFPQHRRRFIAGRAAMRLIVGSYTELRPEHVRFRYTPEGKPSLEHNQTPLDLRFNLSHSRNRALLAITLERDIGVDIEFADPEFPWRNIAGTICTPDEIAALVARNPSMRIKLFFDIWTRKEAYVKAHGLGFSMPVIDICVWPVPKLSDDWILRNLDIAPAYSAAIAVRGAIESVHFSRLTW